MKNNNINYISHIRFVAPEMLETQSDSAFYNQNNHSEIRWKVVFLLPDNINCRVESRIIAN